ncbi:hypothetical protein ACFVW8_18395 [Streptomyces sp. NPDC058221]|uniref:hypothetical protein n=1 Tax=Streptomyces sp. NPDC058221 TaxID=3346388 RepID=UPI0036EB2957
MTPIHPGPGAGPAAPDTRGELVAELSSFTAFRDRVDELLRGLGASPAAPGKLGADPLGRGRLGGGRGSWAEADALHGAYRGVIDELERLSTLLSDSIEGLGIAVLASHQGYERVDVDVRDRALAIRRHTNGHPAAKPAAL